MLRSTKRIFPAVAFALLAAAGASAQNAAEQVRYQLAGAGADGRQPAWSRGRGPGEAEVGRPAGDSRGRALDILQQMESERGGAGPRVPRQQVPGKSQDAQAKREELLGNPKGTPGMAKGPPPKAKCMPAKPKCPPATVKVPPVKPKASPVKPRDPPGKPRVAVATPKPTPAQVPEAQKRQQIQSLEAEIAKLRKAKAPPVQIQSLEVRLANLRRSLQGDPRAGATGARY